MNTSGDWEHPDLVEVSQRLQRRLDVVLDAEQAAAASLARRSTSMFDKLLEAEDRRARIAVGTLDGATLHGGLVTAAFDHLQICTEAGMAVVPIDAITWITIL